MTIIKLLPLPGIDIAAVCLYLC